MNADEIVRALRSCSNSATRRPKCEDCPASRERLCVKVMLEGAADLIESLQAQLADYHHMSELVDGKMKENQRLRRINENLQEQLAASQRREKDAVEYLNYLAGGKKCPLCKNVGGCDVVGTYAARRFCKRFEWRGPQEAEKGENNA